MRLSEAIALGRSIISPMPGNISDENGSGCALGMGLAAVGVRTSMLLVQWPWLSPTEVQCPCVCSLGRVSGYTAITHIFDCHVCGTCDWTLDQLIDWVRSVEPAEAAPKTEQEAESEAHIEVRAKT